MTRIDLHQHIWTEPLLRGLEQRDTLPMVRRSGGLTVLYSGGEQPYLIDVEAQCGPRRARDLHDGGIDATVIALSSPIGIEALGRDAALELIDAHLDGVAELGGEFGAWGPLALDRPDPDDVDALVARGCVGVSVAAGALCGAARLEALGPVFERVAALRVPLFVHPGPAPGDRFAEGLLEQSLWWRALTDYVSQMQAAWLTFAAHGRREHPQLTVVWAMLAGCAPLQHERLQTRGGGPVLLRDPRSFYDTSSYGPTGIDAVGRVVGEEQLVYGSDRPVIDPLPSGRDGLLQAAGALLLGVGGGSMSLQREELDVLVQRLVAEPDRWRHLVRHDPARRSYEQIWDEDDANAWVICWSAGHDTGFHDHDDAAASLLVVEGLVREDRLRFGAWPDSRVIGRGELEHVPATAIHRVRHEGGAPAVTIHAYSPPLRRTGAYSIDQDGRLERAAQHYEQDLAAA